MKTTFLFVASIFFIIIYTSPISAQVPKMIGMTETGGEFNSGTIFTLDTNGQNHEILFSFDGQNQGEYVSEGLIETPDGKFYGMTEMGGSYNHGVIFQFNPEHNTYIKVFSFNSLITGGYPRGKLLLASNNKLYGITKQGGSFNCGTLFEFDPQTKTFTKKVDLDGITMGSAPIGSLMQAQNGSIYGLTRTGGSDNSGVLFQYDIIADTWTTHYHFISGAGQPGSFPEGDLVEATDGNLYGLTAQGGLSVGAIFQFNPNTNTYTKKFDFNGTNGSYPLGSMTLTPDGNLYGLTSAGGTSNYGVVFQYNPITNTYSKKLDFIGTNGNQPRGDLTLASNGKLYGMTKQGGFENKGVLFEYNPTTNNYIKLVDLGIYNLNAPSGTLIQSTNGNLLGLNSNGGTILFSDVIFEYDILSDTCHIKHEIGAKNAFSPNGSPTLSSSGTIYGMANGGGNYGLGAIFEYIPATSEYFALAHFDGSNTGSSPQDDLTEHSNGKFYGLTSSGGLYGFGTLFQYDPLTDSLTKKVDFDGPIMGKFPQGSLIEAHNGKLYGTTDEGGAFDGGVIFQFDPLTGIFTKLLDFTGSTGFWPRSDLNEIDTNIFYGVTTFGGFSGNGTLFKYELLTNSLIVLANFDDMVTGSVSLCDLIIASDGLIYGMTKTGGINGVGTLFSYDTTSQVLTKEIDFNSSLTGAKPRGSLFESSNGKIYGMTYEGGASNMGTLFEFNPSTSTFSVLQNFSGTLDGSSPGGELIEANLCLTTYSSIEYITICAGSDYLFPDGTLITNILNDTAYVSSLSSIAGCDSSITTNIEAITLDTSINQINITLSSTEIGAFFQWLDCANSFAEISGATSPIFIAPTTGSFALAFSKNGCVDTSLCIAIDNSDFYSLPGYQNLSGNVFALPVTSTDTCDAFAYSGISGGIQPYQFNWATQFDFDFSYNLDSACEGIHSLLVTDNIGDSLWIDYFVTDTNNYFLWYDTSLVSFSDTLYAAVSACLIDYSIPLDSAKISNLLYLYPSGTGAFYLIEITCYQTGNIFVASDTIHLDNSGEYLIYFSLYCQNKSFPWTKSMLMTFSFPDILGIESINILSRPFLYPNPTSGDLTITGLPTNSKISIYNLTGQLITDVLVKTNAVNFDYTELPRGVYFVHINSDNYSGTIKFVKQ